MGVGLFGVQESGFVALRKGSSFAVKEVFLEGFDWERSRPARVERHLSFGVKLNVSIPPKT